MKSSSSFIVTVVLAAAVSTLMGAPDGEARDDDFVPANLKGFPATSPLVIPAAAFATNGDSPSSTNMIWYEGYIAGTALAGGCIQAPVYLPDNTEIMSFYISYIDEDGGQDFSVWLTRTTNTSVAASLDLATVSTTGSSTSVRTAGDTSIQQPIVNLPEYSYYVGTCLPSASTKLISARIYFETHDAIFIDGFENGTTSMWTTVQQ